MSTFRGAHQLCVFHLLRGVTRDVLKAIHAYKRSLPEKSRRRPGRPRIGETIPVDVRKSISKARYLFVTRRKNLGEKQQEAIKKLCTRHLRLKEIYSFMTDIYSLLDKESKTSQNDSKEKYRKLSDHYSQDKELGRILTKHLNEEKLKKATLFMSYENLDSTNNAAERAARRFRKRQKSHYKLRSKQSIIASLRHELMREKEEKERLNRERFKPRPSANLLLKKVA